jgi:hypothetical protein
MIAATPPPLPFPRFAVRPNTSLHTDARVPARSAYIFILSSTFSAQYELLAKTPDAPAYFHQLTNSWRKKRPPRPLHRWSSAFQPPQHKGFIHTFDMFAYLQCSQADVDSLPLFATDSLSFHQLMNSLRKNTRGGGYPRLIIKSHPYLFHAQKEESPGPPGGRRSGAWGLTSRTGR